MGSLPCQMFRRDKAEIRSFEKPEKSTPRLGQPIMAQILSCLWSFIWSCYHIWVRLTKSGWGGYFRGPIGVLTVACPRVRCRAPPVTSPEHSRSHDVLSKRRIQVPPKPSYPCRQRMAQHNASNMPQERIDEVIDPRSGDEKTL